MSEFKEKGRALEESVWHLPTRFTSDDAIQKAIAEQQELARRVNSPFSTLSPLEFERARAVQRIEELKQELSMLNEMLGKSLIEGVENADELKQAESSVKSQLAECCASTGRYDLAFAYAENELLKKEYQEIWDAVWRDDDEWCACPDLHEQGVGTLALKSVFIKKDVWSLKHNRWMLWLKCNSCEFSNVTNQGEAYRHAVEMRAHRQTAQSLVGDKSLQEARNILISQGHTTRTLLR